MNEVLGKDFFDSNFWVYWRTMFDFYEWHSALEMKRYLFCASFTTWTDRRI